MNKSENVSHRKSVLDNENHKRGRKPPNVAKRSGPSKIILNSDKASSQEDKSDKKKTRNSKLDIFEDLKVQLIRKKSSKKSLSNVSNVKLIEVPDGNGIKFESPEVLQNGSFTLRESFIEAITSDKLKKKINSQSIFSRQQPTNDRSPEVKLTRSDYRKIQINEILKGHAQKISSSSSKSYMQIKEAPLQGVAELLIKARDFRNADEMDKIKNSEAANDVERKEKDENKGKIVRKMAANKWMGYPPSKELESRLRGTWTGSLLFQDAEEESGDIDGAEDEGGKKLLDEDEKKRTTYTDRLLFLKSVRKNEAKESEDFNEDEGEENGQIEAGSKVS